MKTDPHLQQTVENQHRKGSHPMNTIQKRMTILSSITQPVTDPKEITKSLKISSKRLFVFNNRMMKPTKHSKPS
jgi:hypothetical protein